MAGRRETDRFLMACAPGKMRTLEQWAWDTSAVHHNSEAIEWWLMERAGLDLRVMGERGQDFERWHVRLYRGRISVAYICHADINQAVEQVCAEYEALQPATDFDPAWSRGPEWQTGKEGRKR